MLILQGKRPSMVMLEYEYGTDMDEAYETPEKEDGRPGQRQLPDDVQLL